MALWVGMDQHFGIGKCEHQLRLDFVHHAMRFSHRHVAIDPDVKLDKAARAARSRAQIVNALEFRMLLGDADECRALFLWPFMVHKLVNSRLRRPICPIEQPCGNQHTKAGISAVEPEIMIEHQRDDYRHVDQKVGLVMDMVSMDRD